MLTLLLVIAAALAASVVAAVAGFGGSAILLPVIVWVFGVQDAIPIFTIAQLIGNLSRVALNHSALKWPVIWRFALGAVPAVIIGGSLFAKAPGSVLVRLLGGFLIGLVIYRHSRWGKQARMSLTRFIILGAVSGFISALVGTSGPLSAPFFLSFGLLKEAYIGTEAMTAVVMHLTKLGVYGSYRLIEGHTLLIGLAVGVVMIAGTFLGRHLLKRVPEKIFPFIIDAAMLVAGGIFIVEG